MNRFRVLRVAAPCAAVAVLLAGCTGGLPKNVQWDATTLTGTQNAASSTITIANHGKKPTGDLYLTVDEKQWVGKFYEHQTANIDEVSGAPSCDVEQNKSNDGWAFVYCKPLQPGQTIQPTITFNADNANEVNLSGNNWSDSIDY